MKVLNFLALVLVVIGALNWGLWGFFQFDLVAWLAQGNTNHLARTIYSIVGLAGVWSIGLLCQCKKCGCSCHKNSKGSSGCCK